MSEPAIMAIQERIRAAAARGERVRAVGGGSKSAIAPRPDDPARLPVGDLQGVVEYEPAEYTVTVRAGTKVSDLTALLAGEGQHLPFDPPFGAAGATLGGTVAAGLSGPGRFRYGGVRDFLLGIRFVDGRGDVHTGGGRVVKNAAGFDFPKLMVGALGRLGVLTELTFKVFPSPEEHVTLRFEAPSVGAAAELVQRLGRSRLDLACLEWEPPTRLLLRVGGRAEALEARLGRVRSALGADGEVVRAEEDDSLWREEAAFAWAPADKVLVKVPVVPPRIAGLEDALARVEDVDGADVPRRYGAGGSVAWLAWPAELGVDALRELLHAHSLTGLAVRAPDAALGGREPRLGPRPGGAFLTRIAAVLDPHDVFDSAPHADRRKASDPDRSDHAA